MAVEFQVEFRMEKIFKTSQFYCDLLSIETLLVFTGLHVTTKCYTVAIMVFIIKFMVIYKCIQLDHMYHILFQYLFQEGLFTVFADHVLIFICRLNNVVIIMKIRTIGALSEVVN